VIFAHQNLIFNQLTYLVHAKSPDVSYFVLNLAMAHSNFQSFKFGFSETLS